MKRHHDGDPLLPGHFVEDSQKLQLMADVEIGSRLVQDDDIRLLTDGTGQKNTLTLAVTDCIKRPVREVLRMHRRQRLVHLLLIRLQEDSKTSCVGVAAHCGHIPAGHQLCLQAAGEHDSHLPGQLPRLELPQFFHPGDSAVLPCRLFLCKVNIAADGRQLPGDCLEDRGLAGSVGTDQGHDLPSLHAYFNSVDQCLSMIADGQMVKVQMNLFQFPAASFLLFDGVNKR